jgi:hypothetical protein
MLVYIIERSRWYAIKAATKKKEKVCLNWTVFYSTPN